MSNCVDFYHEEVRKEWAKAYQFVDPTKRFPIAIRTTNWPDGRVTYEVRVGGGGNLPIDIGDWVVFRDGTPRVMDDRNFRLYYQPMLGEGGATGGAGAGL